MTIVNLPHLWNHLMTSMHVPQRNNWNILEQQCAVFHLHNPGKTKTMFLRGNTRHDVFQIISLTIRTPDRRYIHGGKWVAIKTFSYVVGMKVCFRNRRNRRLGFTITHLHRVKVIYKETRIGGRYNVTTAYPII